MTQQDLQWVQLNDFRPGIKGRTNPATISQPKGTILGAASKSNTFRCWALADGSLAPLPKRTGDTTVALPVASASTQEGRLSISGFHIAGPIDDGNEAHIAYEAVGNGGAGATLNRRFIYWQRVRLFAANQVDTLYSANPTTENPAIVSAARPVWFHSYRAHPTTATSVGTPCITAAWAEGHLASTQWWKIWPDPANDTSNTPADISTALCPILHFIHQGRSCIVTHNLYNHGSLAGSHWQSNEEVWFTNSNLKTIQGSVAQVFGMENATGIGAALSTSFSELLLIKSADGGLLCRGDMADPTNLRLPGVPRAVNHEPANTPVGVVYIADDGVHLWNGGEQSENISTEALIGDDFVSSTDFVSFRGRICYWRDWVFFPQNWVWDYRGNSWWKLDDTANWQGFYFGPQDPVNGERLYSAPPYVVTGGTNFSSYAYNTPCDSYQWTSLPVPMGSNRDITCREVVVVATGVGTINVEITQVDGGATENHNLSFTSSSSPQLKRTPFNSPFNNFVVHLTSTATSTSAPVIHEVRFGTDERTHAPNTYS